MAVLHLTVVFSFIIRVGHASLLVALRAPETKPRLESQGANPTSSSPEALAAFMRDEALKWGKVIKTSGIKLDAM